MEIISEKKEVSKETADKSKARDYSNEPFFIKKAAASKKTLEKWGFPKELIGKK